MPHCREVETPLSCSKDGHCSCRMSASVPSRPYYLCSLSREQTPETLMLKLPEGLDGGRAMSPILGSSCG